MAQHHSHQRVNRNRNQETSHESGQEDELPLTSDNKSSLSLDPPADRSCSNPSANSNNNISSQLASAPPNPISTTTTTTVIGNGNDHNHRDESTRKDGLFAKRKINGSALPRQQSQESNGGIPANHLEDHKSKLPRGNSIQNEDKASNPPQQRSSFESTASSERGNSATPTPPIIVQQNHTASGNLTSKLRREFFAGKLPSQQRSASIQSYSSSTPSSKFGYLKSSFERKRLDSLERARRQQSSTEQPAYSFNNELLQVLERDSIDGSSAVLEIYNSDEDEDEDSESQGRPGTGRRRKGRGKAKIPDGGWGWVVVCASLVISMIADGVSFSFGLLYIEFLYEFEESKATTAWIGSLFMAVPLLSGPVMSALVDRYGCRKMTILGGLISGTGFVLSSYSHSVGVMYLTFGVIAGLGLGLCYVTAVVSIAFWFDKKRTLAVGLGACGTGIGTFVYAPMTTFFIFEYGWRGTVLILAGTFFNMIVCGAVMRDPEWWILEQKKQQEAASPRTNAARSEGGTRTPGTPEEEFPGIEEIRNMLKNGQTPEYLLQNLRTSTVAKEGNRSSSVVNLPTFVRQSEKVPLEVLESLCANSRLYDVILEDYPSLELCRSASDKKIPETIEGDNRKSGVTMSMSESANGRLDSDRVKQAKDKSKRAQQQSRPGSTSASTKALAARRMSIKELEESNPLLAREVAQAIADTERPKSRPMLPGCGTGVIRTDSLPWLRRQFSTNTHYFKDIKVHRNSVMYRGAVLNLHKYRLRASSCPNIYRNSMTTLAKENEEKWYAELVDLVKGMFDFSMFLELHFFLLSMSTILLFTWFIVPYFYIAEHLKRHGYEESYSASLLSIIGVTNTIGMIGLGWAGDQPWMNVSKTYTVCLIFCGISTILMPILTEYYYLLMATSASFGLFFASNFSFTPVILVELIPLERFTTAYGLSLLCQGIGNLLGPPIAGWIFDVTGTWNLSFILAGGFIIVAGVFIGLIPMTKNRRIWGSGPIELERERDNSFS